MSRGYLSAKPRNYAREKLGMLQRRKNGEIGAITARFAGIIFPGVPIDVFHGFTAFSVSPSENTTESVSQQSFHEIGLYQVEAGPRGGPAPNPNPHASPNQWGLLHNSAIVQQLLGRAATMEPNAWKTALEDQIAVGLANLKHYGDLMRRMLGGVGASTSSSNWYIMCAFTGFSRGPHQAHLVISAYFSQLASVPEVARWIRLRELVVDDCRRLRAGIGTRSGRAGGPWALMRTEQKFESGYLLASQSSGNPAWFVSRYPDNSVGGELEDIVTRVAYNVPLQASQRLAP